MITASVLQQAITFDEYLQLTRTIVDSAELGGVYQNEKTHRYTGSNLRRMNQVLDKMVVHQKLYNLLGELTEEWIWVVLTEPWCGDASWGTPALYILSTCTDKIDFKILLRDQHPEIMKAYQTAGSDSIPKLVCLRKRDLKELGTWGPRPAILQNIVMQYIKQPEFDYKESVRRIHAWYDEDMTASIQDELIDLIKGWKAQK